MSSTQKGNARERSGDFELNLYRVWKRGPDYATRAWAGGLLRDYWRRHPLHLAGVGS